MINVATDTNVMLGNRKSYGVSFFSHKTKFKGETSKVFDPFLNTSSHGCEKADRNSVPKNTQNT